MCAADDREESGSCDASPGASADAMLRKRPRDVCYDAWHRRCMGCDYDLAGLPEGCKCPECGIATFPELRSAKVWWIEPPNALMLLVYVPLTGLFGLGFLGGLLGGALTGGAGDVCALTMAGMLTLAGVIGMKDTVTKLRAKADRGTDSTLHFWSGGVGLRRDGHHHGLWWFHWRDVHRLHVYRPPLTRHWAIRVRGRRRWWLLGWRPTLIKAVARFNPREVALIRNTMRRQWRRAVDSTQ